MSHGAPYDYEATREAAIHDATATRVLLCRLDNDGDVLLSGPAVRAVAAGGARVTYMCSPQGQAAAGLLPAIDEVVVFDAPWISAHPPPVRREAIDTLIEAVAHRAIDQAVILTSFHQSPLPLALLLRLAGVKMIAGISVDYPGALLDIRHLPSDNIHEVERSLSLAERLEYRLPSSDDGRLAVRRDPSAEPAGLPEKPYVVVHPGASVPARAWSPAANARLVETLVREGWAVVITGSSKEVELAGEVAAGGGGDTVSLAGHTDLAALAEVLAGAEAVVVGNTGPAHLAAAVGTPVVSIYAPTVPAVRWRPWKVPHVLLGNQDIGCAGCRARQCPVADQPCISTISVAEVVAAVGTLAQKKPTQEAAA